MIKQKKKKDLIAQVLSDLNTLAADLVSGVDMKEVRRRILETGKLVAKVKKGVSSVASMGGVARAKKLSAKRRSEIAKKAVEARERKRKGESR